ncbi:MAG: phosphatidylserine/phosphatidylglycerophosphate/cardiolipin synthase family protein [Candidatus Sericytochromatia bacterium]
MKKHLISALICLPLFLSSCASDINTVDLQPENSSISTSDIKKIEAEDDFVKAQSLFKSKKGNVPDNGDVNIKIDNLVLARRTFNNSTPMMHIDGDDAYKAMENLIDNAKKNLYIETFLFFDDETGRRIADKLVKKKKQGIDVKVLVDSLGLRVVKTTRIYDYLKNEGIDIRIYNKLLIGIHGINITHRKILIADGDYGITGGMNFGNEYSKEWHDSMTEFHGEVVQDLQREFFVNWKKSGGTVPENQPRLGDKTYGNTPMRVTVTSAHEQDKRYQIKHSLLTLIDNAKKRVVMEGAYFSDDNLVKTLISTAKKGVDVQIIMPKKGDSKVFNTINPATAKVLMKNGVKVFFYQPRFSHMKAALIDNFAIVGSANPDARSFRENQELNVIVEDSKFTSDLEKRLISVDLNRSSVESLDSVQVGFGQRIAQSLLEIIDYYL